MSNYIVQQDGLRVAEGDTRESVLNWIAEQQTPETYTAYVYLGGLPSSPDSWEAIP